jgi:hypothetical protein
MLRRWAGLALLLGVLYGGAVQAQSVGVGVSFVLSPQAAEEIRAWRRANGLDAADPAADAALKSQAAHWAAERRDATLRRLAALPPPPRLSELAPSGASAR